MDARQPNTVGILSMNKHAPLLTSLTIKGIPLRCADFNTISRFSHIQHLTYICTYKEHWDSDLDRETNFDITRDCLFSGSNQRNPLQGLTNLVSLHIEEEIPNVSTENLQTLSLLTKLSHLALHVAWRDEGTEKIIHPITASVYQALGAIQALTSLQVDIASPHMTELQNLKALSMIRCEVDWRFSKEITSLTNLTELSISGQQRRQPCGGRDPVYANDLSMLSVNHLPYVQHATFSLKIDTAAWGFLADMKSVIDLSLPHCDLSNEAFVAVGHLTTLTSLHFSMSRTFKDEVQIESLESLDSLVHLSKLHGRFVSRKRSLSEHHLSISYSEFSTSPVFQAAQDVVLKLHRVPKYSDWMSDIDGDVSCASDRGCKDCLVSMTDLLDHLAAETESDDSS